MPSDPVSVRGSLNAFITDRRSILRGALTAGAAVSLPAVPPIAAAGPPDPVFDLWEAHKAAWARLLRIEDLTDDHETLEEAGRAVDVALNEITNTPPTTVAGMRAVMEYTSSSSTGTATICRRCFGRRSYDRRCWLTNHAARVLLRRRRALIFRPVEGRELGPA
jgi:hypothetical protein